jgi:hypothetical protein
MVEPTRIGWENPRLSLVRPVHYPQVDMGSMVYYSIHDVCQKALRNKARQISTRGPHALWNIQVLLYFSSSFQLETKKGIEQLSTPIPFGPH